MKAKKGFTGRKWSRRSNSGFRSFQKPRAMVGSKAFQRITKTRGKSNPKDTLKAIMRKVIREETNAVSLGNTKKIIVRSTPEQLAVSLGGGTESRYIYRIPATQAIPTQKPNNIGQDNRFRTHNKVNVVGASLRVCIDYYAETRVMAFLHQPGEDSTRVHRITMVSNGGGRPASMFNPGPLGCVAYTLEESGFLEKDGPFELVRFGNSEDLNCVDKTLYTARMSTDQSRPIGTIEPKIDGIRKKPVSVFRAKMRNSGTGVSDSVDLSKTMDIELYFDIDKVMEFEREEGQAIRFNQELEICLAVDCPMSNLNKTNVIGADGAYINGIVLEVYYKSQI
jgi:hypothetical protein